jgi:vitamin B12 transporter
VRLEVPLKSVRPGVAHLPLAAACLLLSSSAWAQSPSVVVVTGSREPMPIDRLAGDVVQIGRATIEASTADSVADLLRREAGVQLSRNGGPGQNTGVLIRGSASVNTVVLVDGVRIGSATLGYAALDGLSVANIDRIEVLRGPGSSLYGADAVGGVVQIFTRRGEPGRRLEARAAVGGYASGDASFALLGAESGWDYAVSAGRERSGGVSSLRPGDQFGNYNPDADGYTLDTAQLQLGFKPAQGHRIGLTLMRTRQNSQYDSSEFLPPDYAQDASPDFRNQLAVDVAALDWRGVYSSELTASARVSHSVDDLVSGGTVSDTFRTTRDQWTGQLAWKSGAAGELVGAVETLEEKATASVFGTDVQRRTNSLVLSLTGDAGAWSWQGDVRRDDNSDFGGVTTARLGGGLQIAPGLQLRALAGTTFRAPSFNDLYYPGYGVATLQPERGRSIEAGLRWRAGASSAEATVYLNRVRDQIGYESNPDLCPDDPSYSFGCARNLYQAQLQGATFSATHEAGALALRAQFDLLDAKDEATGARLNRRAAHQGSLTADWRSGDWNLVGSMLNVGARPDGGATLPAETTLDLSAAWRITPQWRLQAKLLNATDQDLEPARDYQGLGRQAWLVLRYEGGL